MPVQHRPPRLFAVLLLLLAGGYLYGGVGLAAVGGSWYYVLAGAAIALSAVLLWRGNKLGSRVYGGLLLVTLIWGLVEVGADLWALAPRLAPTLSPWMTKGKPRLFRRKTRSAPKTPPKAARCRRFRWNKIY